MENAFENIRLPNRIPVLISIQRKIGNETIDSLRHLLISGKLGAVTQIAILVLFCEGNDLHLTKQLLSKKLNEVYACDIVVTNHEDLLEIVAAKEPERALRRHVRSQVNLTTMDPYV